MTSYKKLIMPTLYKLNRAYILAIGPGTTKCYFMVFIASYMILYVYIIYTYTKLII